MSAVRDADRIIGLLEANGISNIQLIINRVRMNMVKRGDMMAMDDVVEILAINLLGVVPDDENIVITTNRGEPAVSDKNALAGKAFRNIADRIEDALSMACWNTHLNMDINSAYDFNKWNRWWKTMGIVRFLANFSIVALIIAMLYMAGTYVDYAANVR